MRLFAALQVVEGRVTGQCYPRHRHQEFLKFLQRLEAQFPGEKALHLILDNYGTHGHARVQCWLARHPRFVLHFIPINSSWLNLIERGFTKLSQKAVRCAEFLAAWNAAPATFVWTTSVESIPEKSARARQRLEQIAPDSTQPKRRSFPAITSDAIDHETLHACPSPYADLFTGRHSVPPNVQAYPSFQYAGWTARRKSAFKWAARFRQPNSDQKSEWSGCVRSFSRNAGNS